MSIKKSLNKLTKDELLELEELIKNNLELLSDTITELISKPRPIKINKSVTSEWYKNYGDTGSAGVFSWFNEIDIDMTRRYRNWFCPSKPSKSNNKEDLILDIINYIKRNMNIGECFR